LGLAGDRARLHGVFDSRDDRRVDARAGSGQSLVGHDARLRGDAVNSYIISGQRDAIGARRKAAIARAVGGDVRAVTEVITDTNWARSEIHIINYFSIRAGRSDGWRCAVLRRRRVAAKHFVRPINASINDGDVHAIAFEPAGIERVEPGESRWIAVELRRKRVIDCVIEMS